MPVVFVNSNVVVASVCVVATLFSTTSSKTVPFFSNTIILLSLKATNFGV